jgi:hypothetical protein
MKKHVLRIATLLTYSGLVFGTVNASFAQDAKYSGAKFKAATELRELVVSKSTAHLAAATRATKTSGPQKVDLL